MIWFMNLNKKHYSTLKAVRDRERKGAWGDKLGEDFGIWELSKSGLIEIELSNSQYSLTFTGHVALAAWEHDR